MSLAVTIRLKAEWRWEAGDGTQCYLCEDQAWLKQLRLFVIFNDKDEEATDLILCASCGECVKDG